MDYIKQGSSLTAKVSFQFKNPETGRTITIREGQKFWATSCQSIQRAENAVRIDREGKGSISNGWAFAHDMARDLFHIVA